MSCCGGNKSLRTSAPASRASSRTPSSISSQAARVQVSLPSVVVFRYNGANSIVAYGRVTGRKYRFERTGAEVAVDPRDAPSIASITGVVEVRRT